MNEKMTTKRRGRRGYGWLKAGILALSITATVAGVQVLEWQASNTADIAAESAVNTTLVVPVESNELPVTNNADSADSDGITLDLLPIPTVAPAPTAVATPQVSIPRSTVPRPVARSRSSR